MSDGANNDLRQRLASLNGQEAGTEGTGRAAKPGAAKLALALGGAAVLAGAVYVYSQPEGETVLPVRQAQEFQPEGSGFGDMDRPPRDEPAPEPAAVVEADPGGARRRVEQRVEQRPVAHGIAAVLHPLGLAER